MNILQQENNGLQRTENQTRGEGKIQTERQEYLFCETCKDSGGVEKKRDSKRDRIVYIENSITACQPFVIQEVATVQELLQEVCKRFPEMCLETLGMKISNSRSGTTHRTILTDALPYEADILYIHLYLKKHSSV